MFVERALDHNVFELLTPEALETLKEVLLVACEYELEVEYPATIVLTGGTPAQKTARRTWIIGWLEGPCQGRAGPAGFAYGVFRAPEQARSHESRHTIRQLASPVPFAPRTRLGALVLRARSGRE